MVRMIKGTTNMTIEDVCEGFGLDDIGEFSDGYHTFDDLYNQRLVLSAVIVNTYPDICWKSWKDENGHEWFADNEDDTRWFLVCIDTPEGQFSYHYPEQDWDKFNCKSLSRSKPFDGHTSKDVTRLYSLLK